MFKHPESVILWNHSRKVDKEAGEQYVSPLGFRGCEETILRECGGDAFNGLVAPMMSQKTGEFEIAEQEIREELARVLASPEFERAEALSRMVQYVVNRTVLRDTASLKEYFVGVEVFDLPADFDPKCCALVRVQAIRLRRKLDRYYAGSGAINPVRIEVPKGGYVARFGRKPAARAACA